MRWSAPVLPTTLWRELGWRRVAQVAGVCLLLATQILFQHQILEYEASGTLLAFAEYFGEIALVGFIVLLAVAIVDSLLPKESLQRTAALALAVVGGVAAGVGFGLLLRYGDGHYPPALYPLGEAIRWIGVSGALTVVHEAQRRERRAAGVLHEIEIGRMALERRRAEARLKLMQAQIEPHFLFNTLATVKRLFRTEPQHGASILESLMHYLRGALPRMRDDDASLGDELDLINAYLGILGVRMGERLRFSIEAPPLARGMPFPPMMLITLVENAIKHGIGRKPEGGRIDVRASFRHQRLRIEVADTGVGFAQASGTGIGLSNVRERLSVMHGDAAVLLLEHNVPQGVIASIEMPARGER